MRRCAKCGETKGCDAFYGKTKIAQGKRYSSSYCKGCDKARVAARIRRIRAEAVGYAGGKCVGCGYDRCVGALEFHHRDPAGKDFILNRARSFSERMKAEIDKCDLLCANCHREAHYLVA